MTEQDIRRIAQETGLTIMESPVWAQLVQRFIDELLKQIEQENARV